MDYADATREALVWILRPGTASANTAADHQAVLDLALGQGPATYIETNEIVVRADCSGAKHGLVDCCREDRMRFSVRYELIEPVRAPILQIPEAGRVRALDQDGSERKNGEAGEINHMVELSAWSAGSRLIGRRERPHPALS